jgi:hypothetical protein
MVSRAQVDRLRTRIEALASSAKVNSGVERAENDPIAELMRRITAISDSMREMAEEKGEPWPPIMSLEEKEAVVRYLRELAEAKTRADALSV